MRPMRGIDRLHSVNTLGMLLVILHQSIYHSIPSPLSQQAPLGSAQRRQSLFNIGTDAKGKGLGASEAVQSRGLGARATPSLACRVAGLLQTAAKQHLATPPSTLPGDHCSIAPCILDINK